MTQENSLIYVVRSSAEPISINKKNLAFVSKRCFSLTETIANRRHETPSLILVEVGRFHEQANDFASVLRTRPDKLADVPLVAVVSRGPDRAPIDHPFDERIDEAISDGELIRLIERWRCVENDTLPRLAATFGSADIRALVGKLRLMLLESLGRLRAGGADDIAHRVVGACGTLGYRAASEAWLADATDPDVIDELKVVTRKIIYQIACDLERLTVGD